MWTAILASILSSNIVLAEKYPTVAEINKVGLSEKADVYPSNTNLI